MKKLFVQTSIHLSSNETICELWLLTRVLFTIIVTTYYFKFSRQKTRGRFTAHFDNIPLTRLETEQKHGQLMWDSIYNLVHLCDYDNYLSICIIYTT